MSKNLDSYFKLMIYNGGFRRILSKLFVPKCTREFTSDFSKFYLVSDELTKSVRVEVFDLFKQMDKNALKIYKMH